MNKLAKNIAGVTGIALAGNILGLLSNLVLAAYFGAGEAIDVYLSALIIPQIFIMVALDYIGVNFLPIFARVRKEHGAPAAWKLASTVINYIIIFDLLIIGILFLTGHKLYGLFLPGFSLDRIDIVFSVFKIVIFAFLFQSIASILTYLCHYHDRFIKAQGVKLILPITSALFVILLKNRLGIYSIAIGFAVGHFLLTLLLWSEIGRNYSLNLNYRHVKGVIDTFRGASPLIISGWISKIYPLVERYFASGLVVGSIASLGFARRFVGLSDLATYGIATVVFPQMSKLNALRNTDAIGHLMSKSILAMWLCLIPFAAFLGIFRYEVVGFIFERGQFTHDMTIRVGDVMAYYLGVLLLGGVGTILARGFYIQNKTILPAILNVSGTLFYILIANMLVQRLGTQGIALALSVLFMASSAVLFIFSTKLYPSFSLKHVFVQALRYLSFSVGLALILRLILPPLSGYGSTVVVNGLLFTVSYFILLLIFQDNYLKLVFKHIGVQEWSHRIPQAFSK